MLFHFELSLAFFLVQPFDYSIGLVPAVEHFDAGKSELCCQQLLLLMHHLLCDDLTELFHELPEIHGFQNNITQRNLACVASTSVRFRRKERGTRVKDRAKSGLPLVSFLTQSKPKVPFLGISLLQNQTETLATQAKRN